MTSSIGKLRLVGVGFLAAAIISASVEAKQPQLRIAMTLTDIPMTSGQPDRGFEGYRFIGHTLYDALINWDMSDPEAPPRVRPGLATSWSVDPEDKTRWRFELRRGVKFHDGSEFNADAVIWNMEKLFNENAPHYDTRQSAQTRWRIPGLREWTKVDDYTVELKTETPDATFPWQVTMVMYSSPAQFEKVGRDWGKFAQQPSGTGPFKLDVLIPRTRAELVRNENYWDSDRIPKSERVILYPIGEATTRASALLAGEVDFVEAPPPDMLPRMKRAGMKITSQVYPHYWPYYMSFREGSPWRDIRVRKAVNLAIDREGIAKLLGGYAVPQQGVVIPTSPWFGEPTFKVRYDPDEARRLLAEAGYGPNNPLGFKVMIAPSGSGQMLPLPMNEYVQQNLRDVGVNLQFEVVEWETVRSCRRAGAGSDTCRGAIGVNNSSNTLDPYSAFWRIYHSKAAPPTSVNFGFLDDPRIDAMIDEAYAEFDMAKQDKILAELHAYIVDQALEVWVVHDVGPRAMSPKVKGWVQVQNWFQDITPVYVEN